MVRTSGAGANDVPANISSLSWRLAPAKIAAARQRQPVATELGEAEDQRVNQRQQGVHLKAKAVRQVSQVGRAIMTAK